MFLSVTLSNLLKEGKFQINFFLIEKKSILGRYLTQVVLVGFHSVSCLSLNCQNPPSDRKPCSDRMEFSVTISGAPQSWCG